MSLCERKPASAVMGTNNVPPEHRTELDRANLLVERMSALVHAAYDAGSQFAIEHPADRGDPSEPRIFLDERHAPLWLFPDVERL